MNITNQKIDSDVYFLLHITKLIWYTECMRRIEDKKFYRQDTINLAQSLIGKWIVVNIGNEEYFAQISETEAYLGVNDSACHTFGGKRTDRTEPMWQDGGTVYVYLCYGMHYLLNIVSKNVGEPEAVLIRATIEANGPGKLTKYLHIDKSFNNQDITSSAQIQICDDGNTYKYITDKRVGIDYANQADREAKLRYILQK